jgi:hypothetical protein
MHEELDRDEVEQVLKGVPPADLRPAPLPAATAGPTPIPQAVSDPTAPIPPGMAFGGA